MFLLLPLSLSFVASSLLRVSPDLCCVCCLLSRPYAALFFLFLQLSYALVQARAAQHEATLLKSIHVKIIFSLLSFSVLLFSVSFFFDSVVLIF